MEPSGQIPGAALDALSRELVSLKAEYYGKGPEHVRSFQNGEFLITAMRGGITPVERVLIDANDRALVRHVRLRFQDEMRNRFIEAAERCTGRRVLTYESQVLFEPDYVIEIFVLAPTTERDPD